MFSNLKHSIIKKRFNKSLSKSIESRTVSQKEVLSVGVLTTEEISSKFNIQKEIEEALKVRNVKLYSYKTFSKLDEASFSHFSEKDINWSAKFTHQNLQSFLEHPFDLLIGYFNTNNLYLESAVLQSKATFKVGFSKVNSKLYELEIAGKIEHFPQYISELKKYLQILKKLKN